MTPPRFKTVVVDVDAGTHVGTLRLNRPSKSNAIDGDMWTEIPRAVQWLDARSDVRVVVVCGAGRVGLGAPCEGRPRVAAMPEHHC